MVPLIAVSTWASSVVGEKLVVDSVTIVASPSTDKLMNEALSDDTLDVENTKSFDTAGPQMDWMKDIYNMIIFNYCRYIAYDADTYHARFYSSFDIFHHTRIEWSALLWAEAHHSQRNIYVVQF